MYAFLPYRPRILPPPGRLVPRHDRLTHHPVLHEGVLRGARPPTERGRGLAEVGPGSEREDRLQRGGHRAALPDRREGGGGPDERGLRRDAREVQAPGQVRELGEAMQGGGGARQADPDGPDPTHGLDAGPDGHGGPAEPDLDGRTVVPEDVLTARAVPPA